MRRIAAAMVVATLVLAAPIGPAARASEGPTLTLTNVDVAPGDQIGLVLDGWATGAVQIQVCTADRPGPTTDACAYGTATMANTVAGRTTTAALTIATPTDGCPCEVRAAVVGGATEAATPILVAAASGRSTAPTKATVASPSATRPLVLERLRLTGSGRGPEWFGGSASRTLVIRVRNRGVEPIDSATLSISAGGGGRTPAAVDAPRIGTIPAGATRTFRVPIHLTGPAIGDQLVQVRLGGAGPSTEATTSFTTHPWGIVVVLAAFVVLLVARLLRLRRRAAARRQLRPKVAA